VKWLLTLKWLLDGEIGRDRRNVELGSPIQHFCVSPRFQRQSKISASAQDFSVSPRFQRQPKISASAPISLMQQFRVRG
jgi:hypothetical protein